MKSPGAYLRHQAGIDHSRQTLAALRAAIEEDRSDGLTYQQIADALGLTRQRVMRIQHPRKAEK